MPPSSDDRVDDALYVVVDAMRAASRLNQEVVRAARRAARLRESGLSWTEIEATRARPLTVLLAEYAEALARAQAGVRQASRAARSSAAGSQSSRRASDQRRSRS